MKRNYVLAGMLGAAAVLSAAVASAEPAVKPLKVAVTDLDCLNRDGRGAQKENRKFFADLLVQALKPTPNVEIRHVDTPGREAVGDVRMKQYDLSLGGDYVELVDGSYSINVRLYDTRDRWTLGAWHATAPNWRQAFFEGKEEVGGVAAETPALQELAQQVREAVYGIQLWRAVRDLKGSAGMKADVARDPAKPRYPVHDNLTLTVKPGADAFLTVVQLSSTGGASVLYPRPGQESLLVKQNESAQVPGPGLRFRITDQVGFGEDCFKVFLTKEPLRIDESLREPKDAASRIGLLESILKDLGARPEGAWGQATCAIQVVAR